MRSLIKWSFKNLILLAIILKPGGDISAQIIKYKQHTLSDGLPSWEITSLLEDAKGYLWIGTTGGGLAKFDGLEYTVFTVRDGLPGNNITALQQDQAGNIWIGTFNGISKYDGASFHTIKNLRQGEVGEPIKQLEVYKNSIFFLTESGIPGYVFDNAETRLNTTEVVERLLLDANNGNIFYQTKGGTLKALHDKTFSIQLNENEHAFNWLLFRDKQLLSTSEGLFQLSGTVRKRVLHSVHSGPAVYDELEGNLWFGRDHLNRLHFNKENKAQVDSMLNVTDVTCYLKDKEGNIWVGTASKGLWEEYQSEFERIYTRTDVKNIVALAKDPTNETIWLGTQGSGVIRLFWDGSRDKVVMPVRNGNFITSLKGDTDGMWVGTLGGLGKWYNNSITWFKDKNGRQVDSVLCVASTNNGKVWIGRANGGVWSVENNALSPISALELYKKNVTALTYWPDKDVLFIGTPDGVFAYTDGQVNKVNNVHPGFGEIHSLSIYLNKYLVIGTQFSGVVLYDLIRQTTLKIQTEQGLSSNLISFAVPDERDIWVGTMNGLNLLRFDAHDNLKSVERFDFMNTQKGMATFPKGYYIDRNTKIFSSVEGVNRLVKNELKRNWFVHPLHFEQVTALEKSELLTFKKDGARNNFIPSGTSVSSKTNNFYFHFNQINKTKPDEIQYRWKLAGYDSGWSSISSTNQVWYTNLPPGNYVFHVETVALKDLAVKGMLSYSFSISPPFYSTALFKVTMIVLCILVLLCLAYYRVKYIAKKKAKIDKIKQEESQRLRQEIARDFHDEIGNHLAKISNNVGVLKITANGNEDPQLIDRIEHSVKLLNIETKDFIWNINPRNNNVDHVFLYIRDFADRLYRDAPFVFRANADIETDEIISYEISRQIILIFKEALTNILKYAKPRNVKLTVTQRERSYVFSLMDDGVGFVVNQHIKTGGVSNMRYRAEKINADLLIESKMGQGTQVDLVVSVRNPELYNAKYK